MAAVHTVKQLSELAGVSIRTLHYYDEIALLEPSSVGDNGYRYYGEEALLRLQQILYFREMGLGLSQIREILDSPGFDLIAALQAHREVLTERIERLQTLIATIDGTIMHVAGEVKMEQKELFSGFSDEQQKRYEEEASQLYGAEPVRTSVRLWNSYGAEKQEQVRQEGQAIYAGIVAHMAEGPESAAVQALMARWHQHLRYFYEPTVEILRGLGELYNSHPDFIRNFSKLHPDLPEFLQQAIRAYCDRLEGQA